MTVSRFSLGFLLVATSCSESDDGDDTPRIVDQSGAPFFWVCDDDGCDVHRIAGESPALPPCDTTFPGATTPMQPHFSYSWFRFVSIMGGCRDPDGTSAGLMDWSRVLVCDDDEDCPVLVGRDDVYECRSGSCQNVDTETHPLGPPRRIDLEGLCMGDTPRYEYDGNGASAPPELVAELDRACPSPDAQAPCATIPEGCPDPG